MENYIGVGRCLICRRSTLENSQIDPENLVSNVSLLQDFLYCFHINVLDGKVQDLSRACQFCQTCEQFVAEWSSIQTQMTQLTRRAAQLKATLSARLLSTPHIPLQTYGDDVHETINNRMHKSPEVELALMLQQTLDDIRNQLQKKYSVNVMLDKIHLPGPPSNLNQEEFVPLSGHCDNDDQPMDDWSRDDESDVGYYLPSEYQVDEEKKSQQIFEASLSAHPDNDDDEPTDDWSGDDESDAEYLPSEDEMDDEDRPGQVSKIKTKTEEEARSDDSSRREFAEFKEMKVIRKSKTQIKVKRTVQTDGVPRTGSAGELPSSLTNRFKYKGMSFQRNEEDQTYTCDTCGFRSLPKMVSITLHILHHLADLTPGREKRPKRLKAVIPDGPNKFKYNGHGLNLNDQDQCYDCGACDFKGTTNINSVLVHIRELHYTEEDKVKFTAVKTGPNEWLYGGKCRIIKINETYKCVSCGCVSSVLKELYGHIRTEHMGSEGPDEVPLPVIDPSPVFDSTPTQGIYNSVPYTFTPTDNTYTCGICQSRVSSSRINFGRHVKERHTDAALSVICEICGKELASQSTYQNHLKKHQTKPMNCPTCNKQFRHLRSFRMHLKVHTLGDAAKKYQCEYCGKKFLSSDYCKTHVLIHTGEMPHECQDCGQKFRYAPALAKHRQSAHGVVVVRRVRNLIRINDCDDEPPDNVIKTI